jgi:hypothetical protein
MISGILGMLLGMVVVYLWMSNRYITKKHQKQVASFVARMRKLNKIGKTKTIDRSIESFAYQCMEFGSQVFLNFKIAEFTSIAHHISRYDNQKVGYQNMQDDVMNTIQLPQNPQEYITNEEVHTKICEIFRKIIYKK